MASDAHTKGSGSTLGPRQYIQLTLGLAVVTVLEIIASYAGLGTVTLVTVLIVMSAVKFGVVVALFMHLRFESRVFTQMFMLGLILATAILIGLLALIWNDSTDALGGEELPPWEHHGH